MNRLVDQEQMRPVVWVSA